MERRLPGPSGHTSIDSLLADEPGSYQAKLSKRLWNSCDMGSASECWQWQKATDSSGHGQVSVKGTTVLAHRAAKWLTTDGSVQGYQVNHTCQETSCINPDHLYLSRTRDDERNP